MTAPLTIAEALRDPKLFGEQPVFRDLSSWRAWLVFLKALYGLPLEAEEVASFQKHTGREAYAPPPGGWKEVVAIVGRQSGKTRVASLIASYEAALAPSLGGDRTATYALLVAQDHRAALRTIFEYASSSFEEVELLRRAVREKKSETLSLSNGVTLAAYPCRPEAVRGLRARVVVADELAFYRASDYRPVDREMLRAVRPTLATTGGRLVILSSPYGQSGALWDLHRRHWGREGSPVLVWQATAPDMNPTLPRDYLERMKEEDPEAYRSEVLGEFRSGVSTLFDPAALDAVVVPGRRELPPAEGLSYVAFTDPSGGSRDAFTLAIAHRDGSGGASGGARAVLDAVRSWRPPFNPSGVVTEAAEVLKTYRLSAVTGDRYAGEWPREAFRSHGVEYKVSERDKSAIYLAFLPIVNSGAAEVLDVADLLRELRGLERRVGASGRDRVDHLVGAHDDLANAAAGALVLAGRQPQGMSIHFVTYPSARRVQELEEFYDPRCA